VTSHFEAASLPHNTAAVCLRGFYGMRTGVLLRTATRKLGQSIWMAGQLREAFSPRRSAGWRNDSRDIDHSDADGIECAAHKIKGSVSFLTVPRVTQAAFDLEIRGRNRDLKDVDLAFAKLGTQLEELVFALSGLRQQLCPQPS
jgi:HPt (histidine-containing phosphotransfer) domain-containing protein